MIVLIAGSLYMGKIDISKYFRLNFTDTQIFRGCCAYVEICNGSCPSMKPLPFSDEVDAKK